MDVNDIATRIANIILSPDSITGLINGALTVPLDFGYLVYGYLDTESRYRHGTERIRMATAIKNDILNRESIMESISNIFDTFNQSVPESDQDKVYRAIISSIIGRMVTNTIIAKITSAVLERVSFIAATSSTKPIAILSTVLLLGGMIERSIRTSEDLQQNNPEIYAILRPKDYDLLYFLIEPAVKPFVDAIHARKTHGDTTFKKIIELVGKKINA
ncbi:hypothetical protein [Rouxiella sp. Mn2063]|uniref:hypothetical protein n=1 Tax=Rouxiella sp. Mn2063 TaxID=3395262 RepID=UPI003BCC1478